MSAVEIRSLAKSFGAVRVLDDIDLSIADGEFLTLVGPSGCGKSTLLRVIAGLELQDAGTVAIGGMPVDHLRPHERKIAMVFQNYALYPHMSVFDNIAMPLVMSKLTLAERIPLLRMLSSRRRRLMQEVGDDVQAVAAQLRIESLLHRRPAQLSGGQRQRVALGRAMVRRPDVFLMDEPLSNLDAKLRVHMRTELAELHARLGATFIYVTHDQVEAMTMSDRVAVMEGGRILQLGTPDELYAAPATARVAQFIGSPAINMLPARVGPLGRVEVAGLVLPLRVALPPDSTMTVGVRPEAVVPSRMPADDAATLRAVLRRSENLGPERILYFDLVGQEGPIISRMPADAALPSLTAEAALHFDPAACHLFAPDGTRITPVEAVPALHDSARAPSLAQTRGALR